MERLLVKELVIRFVVSGTRCALIMISDPMAHCVFSARH